MALRAHSPAVARNLTSFFGRPGLPQMCGKCRTRFAGIPLLARREETCPRLKSPAGCAHFPRSRSRPRWVVWARSKPGRKAARAGVDLAEPEEARVATQRARAAAARAARPAWAPE